MAFLLDTDAWIVYLKSAADSMTNKQYSIFNSQ